MGDFSTAKQLLSRKSKDGGGWRSNSGGGNNQDPSSAPPRRLGGGKRRGGFNPPYKKPADNNPPNKRPRLGGESNEKPPEKERNPILDDERVQGMDEAIVEKILLEILEKSPSIAWDDIAGLEFAKATVKEIVIAPMLRPDIFTGLRAPPRGLLLFGPPGTGKSSSYFFSFLFAYSFLFLFLPFSHPSFPDFSTHWSGDRFTVSINLL